MVCFICRCHSQSGATPNDQATTRCQTIFDASPSATSPTSPGSVGTPSLDYTVANLQCINDQQGFSRYAPPASLNCSTYTSTYTRAVFDMPSRSDTSLVTSIQETISYVGQSFAYRGKIYGDFCLLDQTSCSTTLCSAIQPMTISIVSSPVRIAFDLASVAVAPYSYLPIDVFGFTNTTDCAAFQNSVVNMTLGNSTETFGTIAPVGDLIGCSYNPLTIATLFGDQIGNTAPSWCGMYADPARGIDGPQLCQVACLVGKNATASEHRRWLVSPIFQVYRVEARPRWNAVIAVLVQTPVSNHTIFIPNAGPDTMVLSNDSKVRVSIAQNYLTQSTLGQKIQNLAARVSGYVFAANYADPSAAGPVNQGIFNPYINISAALAQARYAAAGDPWKLIIANENFFPRVSLTPQQRGAGKVPTFNSTGQIAWFFVPDALAQSRQKNYAQNQDQLLARVNNVANANLTAACNAGDLASCWAGIPGWGLNATGDGLEAPSLCQLSSGVNQYSQAYLAALGDVPAAVTAAGPPPVGLFPGYNIAAPNVWINDEQILIDPGIGRNITAVFSLAIDIVDDQQVFVDAPTGALLGQQGQGCLLNLDNGNGTLVLSITNPNEPGTIPLQLTLSVACNITNGNTTGGVVTVHYSGGTPSFAVTPQNTIFTAPFVLGFPPDTNGTVSCLVYGNYLPAYRLPPSVSSTITCVFTAPFMGMQVIHVDDGGWGTATIVVVSVAGSIAFVVIVALIITVIALATRK